MNIDYVNRYVSKKLGIPIKDVERINRYYWLKNKEHVYSFDPRPLNIYRICSLYVNRTLVKNMLLMYVKYIRKYNKIARTEEIRKEREQEGHKFIKALWAIRKFHKFTN